MSFANMHLFLFLCFRQKLRKPANAFYVKKTYEIEIIKTVLDTIITSSFIFICFVKPENSHASFLVL